MFPNFGEMDEEEEGLFFEHDRKENKKAFQSMIIQFLITSKL
jgi:hypothetical protein